VLAYNKPVSSSTRDPGSASTSRAAAAGSEYPPNRNRRPIESAEIIGHRACACIVRRARPQAARIQGHEHLREAARMLLGGRRCVDVGGEALEWRIEMRLTLRRACLRSFSRPREWPWIFANCTQHVQAHEMPDPSQIELHGISRAMRASGNSSV